MNNDDRAQIDSVPAVSQLDRSGFIVTTLGPGFALAVLPNAAQSPIKTGSDGFVAGEIKIPVRDGDMAACRAAPTRKI